MMKTLGLVLALLIGCSVAATAATATVDFYAGWNLVACPIVPFVPGPEQVWNGIDLQGNDTLLRYDAPSGNQMAYDPWGDPAAFGNILLGDGYYINCMATHAVEITGVPDGVPDVNENMTDMWISLPGNQLDGADAGGWHMIGQPFAHDTAWDTVPGSGTGDNVFVTDGTTLKTIADAEADGWMESTFIYFDAASGNQMTSGFSWCDDDHLRANRGYWVKTKRDNIALIIPAAAS